MTKEVKKTTKNGCAKNGGNFPGPGPGRPKGLLNKNTTILKDAILEAAKIAGERLSNDGLGLKKAKEDNSGLLNYLLVQALDNPADFMKSLLGKVIPRDLNIRVNPLDEMTEGEIVGRLRELRIAVDLSLARGGITIDGAGSPPPPEPIKKLPALQQAG